MLLRWSLDPELHPSTPLLIVFRSIRERRLAAYPLM
jgi:hypothetical protein